MMQMRDATKEEQEGIRKYIESISVRMIPITVLEDIKAEIDEKQYSYMADKDYDEGIRFGLMLAYQIVKRHISGKEQIDVR